ncbi:hypothetical protein F3J28_20275 [Enterobacter sp. Ap-1006]|uniref:hypothetical protein n=1 Tax=Enterobacter sp. Ap-1006 TaxID=2608345 RepID=UPI00141F6960|nr:hypothetical protein [Enterobacter sp. Ap-1006]NIF50097.1 hypothetical protein [Enterobacter sp. Ap-1006]
MSDEIKEVFSLKSVPILIGVAGFLSTIVTMFIDVNITLSVRWTIFLSWLFISILIILCKIINDIKKRKEPPGIRTSEKPIDSLPEKGIFIIRKNDLFAHSSVVGCFWEERDGVETIAFVGVVHHVQEKLIQIKVIKNIINPQQFGAFSPDGRSKVIIRPVIPFDIISELNGD